MQVECRCSIFTEKGNCISVTFRANSSHMKQHLINLQVAVFQVTPLIWPRSSIVGSLHAGFFTAPKKLKNKKIPALSDPSILLPGFTYLLPERMTVILSLIYRKTLEKQNNT